MLTGVFVADGTPKVWNTRPQVVPGIERVKKKQHPLGDLSFVMGASVVLNEKAHVALKGFLERSVSSLNLTWSTRRGSVVAKLPLDHSVDVLVQPKLAQRGLRHRRGSTFLGTL